jgi:hypothetical protein
MSEEEPPLNPFLSVLKFEYPRTYAFAFTKTLGPDRARLSPETLAALNQANLLRANVRAFVGVGLEGSAETFRSVAVLWRRVAPVARHSAHAVPPCAWPSCTIAVRAPADGAGPWVRRCRWSCLTLPACGGLGLHVAPSRRR